MRRHKYRADTNVLNRTLGRVSDLSATQQQVFSNQIRTSFERIKNGQPEPDDFNLLATSLNVLMVRSEAIHESCVAIVVNAMVALERCRQRFNQNGQWGFDGPSLQDMNEAMDLQDEILSKSTPAQMFNALKVSGQRVQKLCAAAH